MGRGNVCTHNECEGLYYLDRDLLDVYRKVNECGCGHPRGFDFEEEPMTARELYKAGIEYDFNGSLTGWAYDEVDTNDKWSEMVEIMRERLMKRFPSFCEEDKWRGSDQHIVLESGLFQIAVVDNEWSVAWCLLERPDIDDEGRNRTLMRRHYTSYLEAIKGFLIEIWGEAIGYGGAWTHGQRYTRENAA